MSFKAEIVDVKSQPAAVIEFKTTLSALAHDLGSAYDRLGAYLGRASIPMAGPPFALYKEMSESSWTVVAGFPVAGPVGGEGDIKAGELPAGRAAMTWHVGPYDELGETWRAFEQWRKAQGYPTRALAWESYISDPDAEPDHTQLKTQLFWMV